MNDNARDLDRRTLLGTGLAAAAAWGTAARSARTSAAQQAAAAEQDAPVKRKGRINHSIVHWCFKNHWKTPEMARIARRLGCTSIELAAPDQWPILKEHGLTVAICGSHPFRTGFNNPEEWEMCIQKLRESIDHSAAFGVKNVITFTGFANGIDPAEGAKNCVAGLKKIIGYAEQKGVNLCLEMLNTRDASHPMKGHPGYQGDHTDYCIDIIKQVGSARMKLLFDIYHVQIMDGDVIRRIQQHHEYIGHVHTAGNPGRGELDDAQEINYPAVMQALVDVDYEGFVGHEFIPTRDPAAGLRQAVDRCDV